MMRAATLAVLVMTLSACGGPSEEGQAAGDVQTPVAKETVPSGAEPAKPTPTEPTSVSTETESADAEKATDTATAANVIPARYHGVWDYYEGTCARESDARKEISAKEIMYYESVGSVTSVRPDGDDVVVALDMEGEGETWTQSVRLSLSGKGGAQRLSTTDGEKPKTADEYPSKRC